jgi:hypothetical protein
MSAQDKKDDRAEQQARAQLEGIKEMVAALEIETAAEFYAGDLSRDKCVELLKNAEIEFDDAYTDEELREIVVSEIVDRNIEPEDFEFDEDSARDRIQEDPLSIEIRTGWYTPGSEPEAEEFMILLCTGGPACRIIGELGRYNEPSSARIEYQDWFTPWIELVDISSEDREALLTYARCFWYGD